MKNTYFLLLTACAIAFANQTVKADVIADWTFQSSLSTNNIVGAGKTPGSTQSGIVADIGSGTASAFHATAGTAWSIPSGNGSSNSWSANNWSQNDYYQFQVSTLGYNSITISYDQVGSSTGPKTYTLQYSTDGSSYIAFGSSYSVLSSPGWNPNTASGSAGESFTFDLSSLSALDNLATAYFRVVDLSATTGGAIGGGNVGTSGTDRIDNFAVVGSVIAVPEPSTLVLASLGGLGCLFALRRKR
ncbi:MAG: PEP-CTERM sorting domain-containing protein [Verrucomicrobiae bacterium]|nr:PEP-CTERM sorting domain-containing protein [Verrucomicrobiae bacterium]